MSDQVSRETQPAGDLADTAGSSGRLAGNDEGADCERRANRRVRSGSSIIRRGRIHASSSLASATYLFRTSVLARPRANSCVRHRNAEWYRAALRHQCFPSIKLQRVQCLVAGVQFLDPIAFDTVLTSQPRLCLSPDCDDVLGRGRFTIGRPCRHERPSLFQSVAAPVSLLGLVAHDVRERVFG